MNSDTITKLSNEIAAQIIDKSFWGNEWFAFLSLLFIGLISALFACLVSYLTTRSQNAAIRADFKTALKNLEEQTASIKEIEEGITHDFIEKREWSKTRREKIELLYKALQAEQDQLINNLTIACSNTDESIETTDNNVDMLASLYFKSELSNELECYRDCRKKILGRIACLASENLEQTTDDTVNRTLDGAKILQDYSQARINIELQLEEEMKKLTTYTGARP